MSGLFREMLGEMAERLKLLDQRIRQYDLKVERVFGQDERCQRLAKVEGVGPLVATALVAAVGNAHEFKNGRELSAWLGLVPRQHSSGGRNVLLGISKRGDRYLRTLLIHGARSAVREIERRKDPAERVISRLKARRGPTWPPSRSRTTTRACCGRCSPAAKITAPAPFNASPSLEATESGAGENCR